MAYGDDDNNATPDMMSGYSMPSPTSGGNTDNSGDGGYTPPTDQDQEQPQRPRRLPGEQGNLSTQQQDQPQQSQSSVDWGRLRQLYNDLLADHGMTQQAKQDDSQQVQSPYGRGYGNQQPLPTTDRDPTDYGNLNPEDQNTGPGQQLKTYPTPTDWGQQKGDKELATRKDMESQGILGDLGAAVKRKFTDGGESFTGQAENAERRANWGKPNAPEIPQDESLLSYGVRKAGEMVSGIRGSIKDYASGVSAMTPQEYQKAIDRQRDKEIQQQNPYAAAGNTKTETEVKGSAIESIAKEKGDETAKDAIHTARGAVDSFRARGAVKLNSGDVEGAVKDANEAYSHSIDGKHITFTTGVHGVTAMVHDTVTGTWNSVQLTIPQFNEMLQSHVFDMDHMMHMGADNLFSGLTQSRGMDIRASNAEKIANWGMKEPNLPAGVKDTSGGMRRPWLTEDQGYGSGRPFKGRIPEGNEATQQDLDTLRQRQEEFAGYRPTSKGLIGSEAPNAPLPSAGRGEAENPKYPGSGYGGVAGEGPRKAIGVNPDGTVQLAPGMGTAEERVRAAETERSEGARQNINKMAQEERRVRGVPEPSTQGNTDQQGFRTEPGDRVSINTPRGASAPGGGDNLRRGPAPKAEPKEKEPSPRHVSDREKYGGHSLAGQEYAAQRRSELQAQAQAEAAANRPFSGRRRKGGGGGGGSSFKRKRGYEEGGPVTLDGQNYQKIDGVWHRQ